MFGTLNVRIWGASKSSRRFPPSCPGIRGMTDPVGGQGWTDKRDKHPWQLWFTFIEILKIFNHDNPKHVHFLYILPQTRPPIHADCNPHFADSFLMSHHLSQMKSKGGTKLTHLYLVALWCYKMIFWIFFFGYNFEISKNLKFLKFETSTSQQKLILRFSNF